MGLFINNKEHLDLYKEDDVKNMNNQATFRSDAFTEAAEKQRHAFNLLNEKHAELQNQLHKHKRTQTDRWNYAGKQLEEIMENQLQQNQFENNVLASIQRLGQLNEELQNDLNEKRQLNEELVGKIERLNLSNSVISERLEKVDKDQVLLLSKMDTQIEKQKHFAITLDEQTVAQSEISERLEKQEGFLEKLAHQLNFLRSVIFERSHFITEKIDNSYQLTTTYLSKMKDKIKQSD